MMLPFFLLPILGLAQTVVNIHNGPISPLFIELYNQDAFLGIPYAAPPVGALRFTPPEPFEEFWNNTRPFTEYGDACISTGGTDNFYLPQSEDCLTLNVVRPHGNYENLPVGIWIHGGGFYDGSSRRDAYNLSYIVQNSVDIGKPFIGVSINYRLNGFGFLNARDTSLRGWSNIGLRDQLAAIEWVHENIAAFGGNPEHLVLWGESAGAISIGILLNSGLLDDCIKGGIMESGVGPSSSVDRAGSADAAYVNLTSHFNCDSALDPLVCLQGVSSDDLHYFFNTTNGLFATKWFPYIDGDIIPRSGYQNLVDGSFTKVPLLLGENTDEGASFINPNLNTTEDLKIFLRGSFPYLTNASIDQLNDLYPEFDGSLLTPLDQTSNVSNWTLPPGYGPQYRRGATLWTDLQFAAVTRFTAEYYSQYQIPVYKYRFNIPDLSDEARPWIGTEHFQEVVYVFDNDQAPQIASYGGTWNSDARSPQLSKEISKHWASFIANLDPNFAGASGVWPVYKDCKQNRVFDINGFYNEDDNWRAGQFGFIESIWNQLNF